MPGTLRLKTVLCFALSPPPLWLAQWMEQNRGWKNIFANKQVSWTNGYILIWQFNHLFRFLLLSATLLFLFFKTFLLSSFQFSSVQSLSRVWLSATTWIAALQASLSITNSWSSVRLTSIKSVMFRFMVKLRERTKFPHKSLALISAQPPPLSTSPAGVTWTHTDTSQLPRTHSFPLGSFLMFYILCLDKCITACICHHSIIQSTFIALQNSVLHLLSPPSTNSWWPMFHFLHNSFPKCHTVGIIQYRAISDRLLWLAAAAKSLQSCLTQCDPIDGSPPGSPIPGILQARTLEWVAISLSNAWKWKVKVKSLSGVQLLATPWIAAYQAPLSMGFSRQEYWSGVPSSSLFFDLVMSI